MSFLWGTKTPLAETLGRNTLKYREARDAFVKTCSETAAITVATELGTLSMKSIAPEAKFDFASADFQKKVYNLSTASDEERARILTNVVAKLKDEKVEPSVDGAVLTVKWTVPVAAPPVVATLAVAQTAAAATAPAAVAPVATEAKPVVAANETNKQ